MNITSFKTMVSKVEHETHWKVRGYFLGYPINGACNYQSDCFPLQSENKRLQFPEVLLSSFSRMITPICFTNLWDLCE